MDDPARGHLASAGVDSLADLDRGDLVALSLDLGTARPRDCSGDSATVLEQVPYTAGETGVHTTAEEAAALGKGVCQDHVHIFLGAARALGIPARYVSGYLMMNDRVEQEATHAWAEAHVDMLGWVGFDVSNRISPDERYVRVATGRDYGEAAPITGLSYGAGETVLEVRLAVEQQRIEQ